MTIAITGASGQLGSRTAELLLGRVDPADVVLVSRTPESASALGAGEVRFGDFDDPVSLESAFAGVDVLLLVSVDVIGETRVARHRRAIDAAKRAGVGHVVYTSIPNPTAGNPAEVVPDHRLTEEALEASGLTWTFLRNALYTDLLAGELAGVRASGRLPHNEGEGRTTRVAREDCAAVAAAVLADPTPHANVALDVTGPALLSADDRANAYAALLGRDVTAIALDDDAYEAGAIGHGVPAELAGLLTSFGRAIRVGALDAQTDVVQRLTGRPPRSLSDVLA